MANAILPECGIYAIRNTVNGHLYIGSSSHLERRIRDHKRLLRRSKHHSIRLQRAWDIYGAEAFTFEIIELVPDVDLLLMKEQHYIDTLDAFGEHGYNMLPKAGSTRNFVRPPISEETREKKRAASLLFRHDDASKAKISAANKGLKRSPEERARIAAMNIGRKLSPESIAKRSAKIRGIKHGPYSEERRKNISESLKGKPSKKAIQVSVGGVVYRSITEAMTQLKCSFRKLKARIKAEDAMCQQ